MKKLFGVLVFVISLSVASQAQNTKQLSDSTISLRSIQADFIQEKHLKILARPLISRGTFTYEAPQSLRWEYVEPLHSVLIMHEGQVKKFIERDGRLVEDHGLQIGSMQVVLAEISDWLDGRFSDNEMFTVVFVDEDIVRFTPRDQALSSLISGIELKLAGREGLLDSVTISEGPESYTKMIFSNRILNQPIPVSLFTRK